LVVAQNQMVNIRHSNLLKAPLRVGVQRLGVSIS